MGESARRKDRDAAMVKERAAKKKRIRLAALSERDNLTAEQRRDYSDRIVKNLTSLPCYREADGILTYISFRSEVDTFPLMERAFADGKAVFAPKVSGKEMDFFRIYSSADLTAGYRGILEPTGGQLFDEMDIDWFGQIEESQPEKLMRGKKAGISGFGTLSILVCMPGAAFDRARHRIGYGGGFYDRFLSGLSSSEEKMAGTAHSRVKITTAALAFGCQIFETIPWETYDICPERIITETETI